MRPLKLSTNPAWVGLPGAMNATRRGRHRTSMRVGLKPTSLRKANVFNGLCGAGARHNMDRKRPFSANFKGEQLHDTSTSTLGRCSTPAGAFEPWRSGPCSAYPSATPGLRGVYLVGLPRLVAHLRTVLVRPHGPGELLELRQALEASVEMLLVHRPDFGNPQAPSGGAEGVDAVEVLSTLPGSARRAATRRRSAPAARSSAWASARSPSSSTGSASAASPAPSRGAPA